jgi:hypothetical protein
VVLRIGPYRLVDPRRLPQVPEDYVMPAASQARLE